MLCVFILSCTGCSDDTASDAGALPDAQSADAPDVASDVATADGGLRDVQNDLRETDTIVDTNTQGRVELGLGIVDFTTTVDGSDAELVAGPQGGWHVDVALRLFDLEPDGALLTLQGFDADTGEALTVSIARRLTRTRVRRVDDHWLRLGDQMVFDVGDPAEITDRNVRLMATVAEADGREASGELRVHIVDEVE